MTTDLFPVQLTAEDIRDVMDIPLPSAVCEELRALGAVVSAKRVSNGTNYSIDVGLYDERNAPIKARAHSVSPHLSPSVILGMMPRARAYAGRVK